MRGFYVLFLICLLVFPHTAEAYVKEQVDTPPLHGNYFTASPVSDADIASLEFLLSQQKVYEAYELIRKNGLLETKEGYSVLGDLAMLNKKYHEAAGNYFRAVKLAPDDSGLKNKLANSYLKMGFVNGADDFYRMVLAKDPQNIEAKMGEGFVEIGRKNFEKARHQFRAILKDNPDYRPAKIAIAKAYIADNEKFNALGVLDNLPVDNESKLMKAQIFYDFGMQTDSKNILKKTTGKESEELRTKIRRDDAITITPQYTFFWQRLADEFHLNYQKYSLQMAKDVNSNANVFMEYNVYWYDSNSPNYLYNVVNEFKGGVQARPSKKWEYRADVGVKAFQFGDGAMIVTDSWIKHYFNDKFNLKFGVKRNNVEQSYTAAVGKPIDGIFTGRVADTKFYLEYQEKLPKQSYTYGKIASGFMYGQNLPTNPYGELLFGIGKVLYDEKRNPWIQSFTADLMTYNSTYQTNLLYIYNKAGARFGGYFSPIYFNATTLNLKAEGEIKKWRLKYGVSGFGGVQTAITPDTTIPAWGFSPYLTYDFNDNVTINASYNHYNYADVQRDLFMINAVIRGFNRHKKK